MSNLQKAQERIDNYADSLRFGEGIDFDQYLDQDDKAKVKDANHWQEKVKQYQLNPQESTGKRLPWLAAGDHFRIRAGETTIHTGYNGHKKSLMLGFIQLGLIAQSEKCLNISLEMPPHITLDRQIKQFAGNSEPTMPEHDQFFNFVKDNLYIYDQVGTMKWRRVIAVCRYAIQELGVTQLFLDSLMKFGIKSKDHETQAEFVDELTTLGKDTGAHCHLVAHAKKPGEGREHQPPSIFDISGSADLSNMVDNVLVHFSDKREDKFHDQYINVNKQRNPESEITEPSIWFDFDSDSLQFIRNEYQRMTPVEWEQAKFN